MDRSPSWHAIATAAAGLAGSCFLAVATSPWHTGVLSQLLHTTAAAGPGGRWWELLPTTALATLVGLWALRWWPYLLLAGGVLSLPAGIGLALDLGVLLPLHLQRAAVPLLLIGVLACAQALVRAGAAGLGAAVAGTALGAQLFGTALFGAGWLVGDPDSLPVWHLALTTLGLAGAGLAVWRHPRGDDRAGFGLPAGGPAGSWRRWRLIVAGVLATCVGASAVFLTQERVADLLDISAATLSRHPRVLTAAVGLAILVAGVLLAALAGVWSLAGGLVAATVQVAVAAPILLAVYALSFDEPVRWAAALAGVVAGAAALTSRWRVPVAGAAAGVCALVLFIAVAATSGEPEKLIVQQRVVPAALLLALIAGAATLLVGGAAPALARRGAAPAVLGPIVAALVLGGEQALEITYLSDGAGAGYLEPVRHLGTSAGLLLLAAAGLGGLAGAELLAGRRAERRATEQVRREAAEAERTRLARAIHDGVLQVLSLVQRQGPELGRQGSELADLAGEQEVALRSLITSGGPPGPGATGTDLRTELAGLASPMVDLSAPAAPVVLPAEAAGEVRAAVAAALDNVRRHGGPDVRAWLLVEEEPDGVRVTVRDDGPGIPQGRLAAAAAEGRLGVAQSMRGRIADLAGETTITSRPGEGTEVEFWVPRPRRER